MFIQYAQKPQRMRYQQQLQAAAPTLHGCRCGASQDLPGSC